MNVDFHAHILPKADHGSDGIETSLRQVALAKEAGIDLLAATPHFYPARDTIEDFLQRRETCFAELKARLPKDAPRIVLAAEVQLCRGLENVPQIEQLCFAGTRVLLLELPPDFRFRTYERTLDALRYERNLTVVFAHLDRYAPQISDELLAQGFLGQLNAAAFCSFFSKKRALRWVQGGSIVALGSDLHGTATGYTQWQCAKERLGKHFEELMCKSETLLKAH